MLKAYLLILCCLFNVFVNANLPTNPSNIPHLVLHFDVNKTLIASDKTENKTTHDVINELLSKKYSACWDERVRQPITFYHYIKKYILPGEDHDATLKVARLVHLIHFIDYLKEHHHPLYTQVHSEYQFMMESLKGNEGIFPSFYILIEELDRRGISYTLFLRSFGKEVFEIKNEINNRLQHHIATEGIFQKGILCIKDRDPITTNNELYHFFNGKEHAAIRDDWHYWMEGEHYAKFGKQFPIDPEDRLTLPIFFDDNIDIHSSEKNIVAPFHAKTGKPLSISSLLQSKQLVPVDTLQAILKPEYFLDKVEEAIKAYHN